MPAVKYNYDYNRYGRNGKDVANNARSYQSSSSAGKRVSSTSTSRTSRTPESTRNSTRMATKSVATTSSRKTTTQSKRNHKFDIDVPIIVKKKVSIQKPQEMKLIKPKAKSKAKVKVEGIKRKIVLSTSIVFVLFLICVRYTEINEKFNEVNSLEKSLSSTKALNQQLSTDIESKTDLNYIEKYAKYQLGMQKPSEGQIVRIAYEKHDKISTPVVIEEVQENSFLDNLLNDLKKLID